MTHARAGLLAIGNELLAGSRSDTNSPVLAATLLNLGIEPVATLVVGDDRGAITRALRHLAGEADAILCTGGLGPTEDDLTRHALADLLGVELVSDPAAAAHLRAYFAARGRPVPEPAWRQALRPIGADMLPNGLGTAWGLHARWSRPGAGYLDIFCLPGPPAEMHAMFEAHVRRRLCPPAHAVLCRRRVHVAGLGESELAERLGDLMARGRNPEIGTTVGPGLVTCTLRWRGPTAAAAAVLDAAEACLRERLDPYVIGRDDQTLAGVVVEMLATRGQTAATVESCTGGWVGATITDVPGASNVYVGGWIAYANTFKTVHLGVPAPTLVPPGPGAVSEPVARALALAGLERTRATHCLAITGIAGPGGGTADKPVGTVFIALASRTGTESTGGDCGVRRFLFPGDRATVRLWAVATALAWLRLRMLGHERVPLAAEMLPPRG